MSKRNKIVKETKESKALKAFRLKSGLSLRKLAERMDLSFARVHQMEVGREDVIDDYIEKFLSVTDFCREDWDLEVGQAKKEIGTLRSKCHGLVDQLDEEKLDLLYGILQNFVSLIIFLRIDIFY